MSFNSIQKCFFVLDNNNEFCTVAMNYRDSRLHQGLQLSTKDVEPKREQKTFK